MQLELSWQSFEKYPNSKFNENLSSGNCVIPHKKTDTSKLTAAFCSFANAPNNSVNKDDISIHPMKNILMVKETWKYKNSDTKLMESMLKLSRQASMQTNTHAHSMRN
jgi:hypothetical protein